MARDNVAARCRAFVAAAAVLFSGLPACSSFPERTGSGSDLAFVGVDVLTMESRDPLLDQTVLVQGGRITAIGASAAISVPPDARVIDGNGRILMPGLVDAHIHLRHANTSDLADYLRAGITCAREMNGRPFVLEWRDQIDAEELLGPCLKVASPTIANFSSPREGYSTPETASDAAEIIRQFQKDGYDWIKIYTFLPKTAFSGVVEASKALDIPIGGHVPPNVGLSETIANGISSIEHLTEYVGSSLTAEAQVLDESDYRAVFGAGDVDWAKIDSFIRSTIAANVWNVPTLVWFDRILPTSLVAEAWSDPELRRQGAANRREIVRRLFEAGALLAVGTDSDAGNDLPASAIHDELNAMLESGINAYEVIRIATLGGATLLGISDEVGTIAVGKRADLLLVSCDPTKGLACLRQPDMVLARGIEAVEQHGGSKAQWK